MSYCPVQAGAVMQRVSSLLAAGLACPLCVHSRSRITARKEANEKGLATERFQTVLNLSEQGFRDVVRKNNLAIRLVGHGGVTEGMNVEGKQGRTIDRERFETNSLFSAPSHAKDEKTFGLCHPKTSGRESPALFVVF